MRDSLRLDAGRLDHALPALQILRQPGAEFGGRAAAFGDSAELFILSLVSGFASEARIGFVQPADHRRRHARGPDQAEALRVFLESREAASAMVGTPG